MFKAINIGSTALKFAIAIIGCVLAIMAAVKWNSEIPKDEATPLIENFVNGVFWVCLIVTIVAAAVAVLFGLYKFIIHIKKNIPQLGGIVVFAIILAIAWFALADWDFTAYDEHRNFKFTDPDKDFSLSQSMLSLSDGGVWAIFILLPLSVVIAVVAEVVNIFK